MAMGMDLAWHGCRAESTETVLVASPRGAGAERGAGVHASAPRGILGPIPQARCSRCGVGMCPTHTCLRCSAEQHADARVAALQDQVDRSAAEARGLREQLDRETAKNDEMRAENERLRESLAATQRDLTQAQIINAGHASWRRDAEAEYEIVRQQLDKSRATNATLQERLEAHVASGFYRWVTREGQPCAFCYECGGEADTPEAIRHRSGERMFEHPCPTLLDLRALGRPALDDSEEVSDHA